MNVEAHGLGLPKIPEQLNPVTTRIREYLPEKPPDITLGSRIFWISGSSLQQLYGAF